MSFGRPGSRLAQGLTSWSLADTYWTVAFENVKHIPYPSLADVGYLMAIPFFFAAIALMIRHRVGHFTLTRWLDGAIAALAAAAIASAILAAGADRPHEGRARPPSRPISPTRLAT